MTDQPPAATVSIDAIYEKVTAQGAVLVRLEAAITQGNNLQEQRLKTVEDRAERHGGRLLEHDKQLAAHALDIQAAHSDIRTIKDQRKEVQTRKATWPQVIGAIGVIVAGPGALIALLITLSNISQALAQMP